MIFTDAHRSASIAKFAAMTVVVLSAAYIATGSIWVASHGNVVTTRGLEPSEPYLAILESLMLLLNPAVVALFAAIHTYAPAEKKTCSLAAFGFALMMVCLTALVHFVQLFVVRQTNSAIVRELFSFYSSDGRMLPMFAADMLAWDFFFGFALLFVAPVFGGDRLQNAIRIVLLVSGVLCLIGVAFPVTGNPKLQLPAILGYAFGFPISCVLLAILFSRKKAQTGIEP
jgi:hypothetical protein